MWGKELIHSLALLLDPLPRPGPRGPGTIAVDMRRSLPAYADAEQKEQTAHLEHPTLEDPSEALKLQVAASLGAAAAAATAASAVANATVAAVAEIVATAHATAAAAHDAVVAVVEEAFKRVNQSCPHRIDVNTRESPTLRTPV